MDAIVEESVAVPARAEELGALHEALARLWAAIDATRSALIASSWQAQFATAVGEIGANIVLHAHPENGPTGSMCLRLRLYHDRVEARFTDQGLAYNPPSDPTEPSSVDPMDLPESGYGLMITRTAIDRLQYGRSRGGTNVWRLVKYLDDQHRPH